MTRRYVVWALAAGAALCLLSGCGRMVLPGRQFREERARTSSVKPVESPLPEEPSFELGAEDAKVRVVAFFPIDDDHKPLMDALRELVKEYPGKLYVKYTDYRTPEGYQAFENAKMSVPGILINMATEIEIEASPRPYTVDFVQDVGRYWTIDDLKKAVAQEVDKAYGKG